MRRKLVIAFGLAMLSATVIEGCKKPTDDKKTQDEPQGPNSPSAAPAPLPPPPPASPTDAVRAVTMAYAGLLTQMRSRTVSVDETCLYFTCDSLTTRGEVEKMVKEHTQIGQQGWRITSTNVPASRMKTRANGEITALLEFVTELACKTPGGASDNDGGVAGCKTARPQPWKRECYNHTYTFVQVGSEWKRTGLAETTQIRCQ